MHSRPSRLNEACRKGCAVAQRTRASVFPLLASCGQHPPWTHPSPTSPPSAPPAPASRRAAAAAAGLQGTWVGGTSHEQRRRRRRPVSRDFPCGRLRPLRCLPRGASCTNTSQEASGRATEAQAWGPSDALLATSALTAGHAAECRGGPPGHAAGGHGRGGGGAGHGRHFLLLCARCCRPRSTDATR